MSRMPKAPRASRPVARPAITWKMAPAWPVTKDLPPATITPAGSVPVQNIAIFLVTKTNPVLHIPPVHTQPIGADSGRYLRPPILMAIAELQARKLCSAPWINLPVTKVIWNGLVLVSSSASPVLPANIYPKAGRLVAPVRTGIGVRAARLITIPRRIKV